MLRCLLVQQHPLLFQKIEIPLLWLVLQLLRPTPTPPLIQVELYKIPSLIILILSTTMTVVLNLLSIREQDKFEWVVALVQDVHVLILKRKILTLLY